MKHSITFDDSVEGELAAFKVDKTYQDGIDDATAIGGVFIGNLLTVSGCSIPGYIVDAVSIMGIGIDTSLNIGRGDTVQSFYYASYNNRGGSGGSGGSIVIHGGNR